MGGCETSTHGNTHIYLHVYVHHQIQEKEENEAEGCFPGEGSCSGAATVSSELSVVENVKLFCTHGFWPLCLGVKTCWF